jgi:uncharacterized protein (TIGR00369 family)
MDLPEALREMVPFTRFIGVEYAEVTPERAVTRLALRPELANHVGTMHAAAQYMLAESAAGAVVAAIFADQMGHAVPLNAQAVIDYRKPAQGDLTATAALTPDEVKRVRADFTGGGKARCTIPVEIHDAAGTLATTVTVEWVILRRTQ